MPTSRRAENAWPRSHDESDKLARPDHDHGSQRPQGQVAQTTRPTSPGAEEPLSRPGVEEAEEAPPGARPSRGADRLEPSAVTRRPPTWPQSGPPGPGPREQACARSRPTAPAALRSSSGSTPHRALPADGEERPRPGGGAEPAPATPRFPGEDERRRARADAAHDAGRRSQQQPPLPRAGLAVGIGASSPGTPGSRSPGAEGSRSARRRSAARQDPLGRRNDAPLGPRTLAARAGPKRASRRPEVWAEGIARMAAAAMKYGRLVTGNHDRNSPSRMAFDPTCWAIRAAAVSGATSCTRDGLLAGVSRKPHPSMLITAPTSSFTRGACGVH